MVRPEPLAERAGEIALGPASDAGLLVDGQVGRADRLAAREAFERFLGAVERCLTRPPLSARSKARLPREGRMPGRLHELLRGEHARFDDRLRRALGSPEALDREAYQSFRKGLLRHIGMEEKLLMPQVRRLPSPGALRLVEQLRADHAALAALLVPTPTREIVGQLQAVLREHNPLEEDPGGLYEICERAAGVALDELLERLRAFPEVPAVAHSDGSRVHQRIERLLRARLALSGEALPARRGAQRDPHRVG